MHAQGKEALPEEAQACRITLQQLQHLLRGGRWAGSWAEQRGAVPGALQGARAAAGSSASSPRCSFASVTPGDVRHLFVLAAKPLLAPHQLFSHLGASASAELPVGAQAPDERALGSGCAARTPGRRSPPLRHPWVPSRPQALPCKGKEKREGKEGESHGARAPSRTGWDGV